MRIKNLVTQLLGLSLITATTSVFADANNFKCPNPSDIQSTDFTAPSIWTAPPVAHSVANGFGVGLGGKKVKEFLGAVAARVGHTDGWVCVYRSEGGVSVNDYEAQVMKTVESTPYLRKHIDQVNKFFDDAEPYLRKFPKDQPIGFVGYQRQK